MTRRSAEPAVRGELSPITTATAEIIATAALRIETRGPGFVEITREATRFLADAGAGDGTLLIYLRHTSASLLIQENADPDVRTDLAAALDRLAPADAGWVHDVEGPDDMPAHVKTMLTGCLASCPGARRRARARHLARHLCRRAPRAAAPARDRAAIHRQPAMIPSWTISERIARSTSTSGRAG